MADPRLHEGLRRYWDELVRGGPATPSDLDPTLTATIRQFHALGNEAPDSAYARRLREELMHAQTVPLPADGRRLMPLNGHAVPRPTRPYLPRFPVTRERRRWAFAQLATAMLLLVTLLAIFVAFRPERDPAVVAPDASPTAVAAPTVTATPPELPTFLGDVTRPGINPGPGPEGVPVVLWALERSHTFWGAPAVVDGVVYSKGTGTLGSLGALDAKTGRELWRFPGLMFSEASPTVVDGVIFAGFSDQKVRAFDAVTGDLIWEFDTGKEIGSTPAVVDGVLYIGTGVQGDIGDLIALNAADGTERWRLTLDASAFVAPAVANGVVYIATGQPSDMSGTVFAVDATTGTERWRFDAGYGFGGIAVVDGVAYTAAGKGVFALDAVTGALKWQFAPAAAPFYTSPAVANGVVYAISDSNQLYALEAASGAERWSVEVSHNSFSPADPIFVDGVIYVAAGMSGHLAAIDAATGTRIWEIDLPGTDEVWSTPAVIDGVIYVGTGSWGESGGLYALSDPVGGTPI